MYETNWSDDDDVQEAIAAALVGNQLSDSEQEYDSLLCFSTIILSKIPHLPFFVTCNVIYFLTAYYD